MKTRLLTLSLIILLLPINLYATAEDFYFEETIIEETLETEEEIVIEEEIPTTIYFDLIDSLTEEEKILIYQITYLESNNQSLEGQQAVIEVILNRVLSNRFPNTVKDVLSQKCQFSTWKNRNKAKYNDKQIQALENVKYQTVLPNDQYAFFATSKQKYAKNHYKIGAHWFGQIK